MLHFTASYAFANRLIDEECGEQEIGRGNFSVVSLYMAPPVQVPTQVAGGCREGGASIP